MQEKQGYKPLKKPLKPGEKKGKTKSPSERDLSAGLESNLEWIKYVLGPSGDLVYRSFNIGREHRKAALIYVDGLVDKVLLSDQILKAVMLEHPPLEQQEKFPETESLEMIKQRALTIGEVGETKTVKGAVQAALSGDAVFLLDGQMLGLVISVKGWSVRGIEEPPTETLIRGPREGFTETIRVNTAMLRRKLKHPGLRL